MKDTDTFETQTGLTKAQTPPGCNGSAAYFIPHANGSAALAGSKQSVNLSPSTNAGMLLKNPEKLEVNIFFHLLQTVIENSLVT